MDQPAHAEFLVPRSRRSIPNWMTIHTTTRWDRRDIINHDGVRTCSATRAIIDLATQTRSARDLERAIDSAIRLRQTALSRLQMRLRGLSGHGRHGCRLLRELLLDSGGESFLERRFLKVVRESGLPRPECQVVFRADGITVARVDFRFPGTNVVVEVSGRGVQFLLVEVGFAGGEMVGLFAGVAQEVAAAEDADGMARVVDDGGGAIALVGQEGEGFALRATAEESAAAATAGSAAGGKLGKIILEL